MTHLDPRRVDLYLRRLDVSEVRLDAAGLEALQRAHLMAVPFHNLLLLANDGRPRSLPPLLEVVDDAIEGVGGNCDRTTPPFTALLNAIGFDARLTAATVREPGDHFVCIVDLAGERLVCDVGNGHPYLRPWLLDGPEQEQTHLGWRFRFDPRASGGPTLRRWLGGDAWKTVYVVDPAVRRYEDFATIVDAHYTQAGFGPFLTGLRAGVLTRDSFISLRDAEYSRDSRFGRSLRRVIGREALASLLIDDFRLPPRLVAVALAVAARVRPELFAEPPWFALGRGTITAGAPVVPPSRADVPDIVVAVATVGRHLSVRRLIDSLATEVRASRYPGRIGLLLVDTSDPRISPADGFERAELPVHRVPLETLRGALDRAARLGVVPAIDGAAPVPIGVAREAQVAAIRAHFLQPVAGLPHPAAHPTVVWLVDDDVLLAQLGDDGEVRRRTHLLFRIARFWSTLPHRSVLLGTFTGDPPVPALDSLGGQLDDLCANIERMRTLGPDAPWDPPASPPRTYDAYYDLTEAPRPRDGDVWPYAWNARAAVRSVAAMLLREIPRLLEGKQLTRPLTWNGLEEPPHPSVRRGGNVVFLDVDALFRWPTPVLACADRIRTRRADTLWAALALSEDPGAVVEVTLPLHHERSGQSLLGVDVRAETTAQVRGIALARALTEGRSVSGELAAREARVRDHRASLHERIERLAREVQQLEAWSDSEIEAAAGHALAALRTLDQLATAAVPATGDPGELETFIARLPEAVRAWRETW